jgi:hypothetical protein
MLKVQEYLQTKTFEDLTAELGIRITKHPSLPLSIANYDQIESPKTNPIVRECRALTLHSDTHEVISKSFSRFFNWGEVTEEMALFDFSDFSVQEKLDGSLAKLFFYDGEWHGSTRASFGTDNMQFQSFNWIEGFCKALGVSSLHDLKGKIDESLSYVCEFVSPWNKIVRRYEQPQMYLLTAFEGLRELSPEEADAATTSFFLRPARYNFCNIEDIQSFLNEQATSDPTFEGVVIRDKNNLRYKIKSASYLGLHKLANNGAISKGDFVEFALSGETSELLCYFPEFAPMMNEVQSKVDQAKENMLSLWEEVKDIEIQKDFALKIVGRTPFTAVLFSARKEKQDPASVWRRSGPLIQKVLF